MSDGGTDRSRDPTAIEVLGGGGASLLEAVDGLLNRGVLLEGDLVLGLADVDLVYLRLSTLLAAADRVLGAGATPPPGRRGAAGSAGSGGDERAGRGPVAPGGDEPPGRGPVAPGGAAAPRGSARAGDRRDGVAPYGAHVDALREELESALGERGEAARPPRWNAEPEDVERSVARLVLALVEFLRKLMERQAIRRMEEGTLSEAQVERLGRALMRLEETVHEMARRFGLRPDELNLDLGPLGRLT